jgi:hypothetical protein
VLEYWDARGVLVVRPACRILAAPFRYFITPAPLDIAIAAKP